MPCYGFVLCSGGLLGGAPNFSGGCFVLDLRRESLALHEKLRGKLSVESKIKVETVKELSLAYTPDVAEPCIEIAKDRKKVFSYTIKGNTVAVVSDGSAVLGLGKIGAEASIPVMEGKALLLKEFAGIDSFPICLDTQDSDEIVGTVRRIAPVFGGINLEDISAPRCANATQSTFLRQGALQRCLQHQLKRLKMFTYLKNWGFQRQYGNSGSGISWPLFQWMHMEKVCTVRSLKNQGMNTGKW